MSLPPLARLRRWLFATWLAVCLLLAQTVLPLHGIAHGPHEHAQPEGPAAQAAGPFDGLFGHEDGRAGCLNFDHACGGDTPPAQAQPTAAAPVAPGLTWATPQHRLPPWPVVFEARGPPGLS